MSALIVAALLMAEDPAKKIQELQKQRIETLKQAADVSLRLARNGLVEPSAALEDRMALLKAEADAAETESDRIAIYQKAVEDLKGYERLAKALLEGGLAPEAAMLRVKARRLEVEILLEQAKIREAKGKR